MTTRVLAELADAKLVEAATRDDGGFDITLTKEGAAFFHEHAGYARQAFRAHYAEHFRYGRPPAWATALLADTG